MSALNVDKEFDFYVKFAKPLVLNLTNANDRILAAAWVTKLRKQESGPEYLRTEYLKLLLFVLQKNRLLGPFLRNPNLIGKLDELPRSCRLQDIAKYWIEGEEYQEEQRDGTPNKLPLISTEYSSDLQEYAAYQCIPNFGIHVYYAFSDSPISNWNNISTGIVPKGAFNDAIQTKTPESDLNLSVLQPRPSEPARTRERRDKQTFSSSIRSDPTIATIPCTSTRSDAELSDYCTSTNSSRSRPSWGSNLIGVDDPTFPDDLFS